MVGWCDGSLLIWIIVGQGPIVLAVGAGDVVWTYFSLIYQFSLLFPSLWETVRYRLKYCLRGPLNQTQPTNQPSNSKKIGIYVADVLIGVAECPPVLRPFQEYFSYIEPTVNQRLAETALDGKETPDLPVKNLASHMYPERGSNNSDEIFNV